MRRFGIIVLGIALLIGSVIWYKQAYPSYTYRYRMIVDVEVDGAIHSGASVIEVTLEKRPRITPETLTVMSFVKGEAVFVDLGGGRNVVALMASGPYGKNWDFPQDVVSRAFGLSWEDRDLPKFAGLQGQRDLTAQLLPTFVTFNDLSDPKSAQIVPPNEFGQTFGVGALFKRAWIEMTVDPVTRGIEERLLFLAPLRQAQRGKSVLGYPGSLTIVPSLFTRN
jgi:hypothetical protein